jgi:uncharacterized membrane protein YgcG
MPVEHSPRRTADGGSEPPRDERSVTETEPPGLPGRQPRLGAGQLPARYDEFETDPRLRRNREELAREPVGLRGEEADPQHQVLLLEEEEALRQALAAEEARRAAASPLPARAAVKADEASSYGPSGAAAYEALQPQVLHSLFERLTQLQLMVERSQQEQQVWRAEWEAQRATGIPASPVGGSQYAGASQRAARAAPIARAPEAVPSAWPSPSAPRDYPPAWSAAHLLLNGGSSTPSISGQSHAYILAELRARQVGDQPCIDVQTLAVNAELQKPLVRVRLTANLIRTVRRADWGELTMQRLQLAPSEHTAHDQLYEECRHLDHPLLAASAEGAIALPRPEGSGKWEEAPVEGLGDLAARVRAFRLLLSCVYPAAAAAEGTLERGLYAAEQELLQACSAYGSGYPLAAAHLANLLNAATWQFMNSHRKACQSVQHAAPGSLGVSRALAQCQVWLLSQFGPLLNTIRCGPHAILPTLAPTPAPPAKRGKSGAGGGSGEAGGSGKAGGGGKAGGKPAGGASSPADSGKGLFSLVMPVDPATSKQFCAKRIIGECSSATCPHGYSHGAMPADVQAAALADLLRARAQRA